MPGLIKSSGRLVLITDGLGLGGLGLGGLGLGGLGLGIRFGESGLGGSGLSDISTVWVDSAWALDFDVLSCKCFIAVIWSSSA